MQAFSGKPPREKPPNAAADSGENRVKSCHVCGCHGFFGPDPLLPVGSQASVTSLSFFSLVFLFPWSFSSWEFPWSFCVFCLFYRVFEGSHGEQNPWYFEVFLGVFEKTKEKKDRAKAGHPKAGRSDFRNQRFEANTGKTGKCGKSLSPQKKQNSEEIPKSRNAENAENADTKTRKMRMTGFNVTGFR